MREAARQTSTQTYKRSNLTISVSTARLKPTLFMFKMCLDGGDALTLIFIRVRKQGWENLKWRPKYMYAFIYKHLKFVLQCFKKLKQKFINSQCCVLQ
jgi:hypothetical protein